MHVVFTQDMIAQRLESPIRRYIAPIELQLKISDCHASKRQIYPLGTGVVEELIEFLLNIRTAEANAILFAVEI